MAYHRLSEQQRAQRDKEMVRLKQLGLTKKVIALRFGVCASTVDHALYKTKRRSN
ncbi:hypothetical protein ES708_05556 [subsurface metagenome]